MLLNIVERLVLLQILPREGDITTLRIVRDLGRALSFSEEEHETFGIKQDEKSVRWDVRVETDRDIEIGPKAHAIICDALEKLSQKKMLRAEHLDIYERFVIDE